MNLAYKWPVAYWNTANLIVDSDGQDLIFEEKIEDEGENIVLSDDDESDDDGHIDDNSSEIEAIDDNDIYDIGSDEFVTISNEIKKKAATTVDYGRVSSAIGKFQNRGIEIKPPDINKSSYTFVPNADSNTITYGLRGITRIPGKLIRQIITNRPYTSIEDFTKRIKVNKLQMLNLIKSGAFDGISHKNREAIMQEYLYSISDHKTDLNLRNMQMLIAHDLIPEEMSFCRELFLFNKKLKGKKQDTYYLISQNDEFFFDNFDIDMLIEGDKIDQKTWDKMYSKYMDAMRDYIKAHKTELLESLNNILTQELHDKYAQGTISRWEMESIGFYRHDHELIDVDDSACNIVDFNDLPSEPIVDKTYVNDKGNTITLFRLFKIAGTVLDKDKLRNTITILTKTGVVTVKVWKSQFVAYDKQISVRGEDGKKKIIEKSWFSRGNILIFTGIKRGQNFIPKTYRNTKVPPIVKITSIENGILKMMFNRPEV